MRIHLLKRLLAVPSHSRHEGEMVDFLFDHVRGAGLRGTCVTDDWNNVFVRKGDAEFLPCVAAHIDTVHLSQPANVAQEDGILFGLDDQGQRCGIGADDKAGVYICLELLERCDNIAVALFGSEEVGCHGAYHVPAEWFDDVGCFVEFDCPGRGLVSYTSGGTRLFANDGDFICAAEPVLRTHGLTSWQHHPFSDVMALRHRFGLSCLNLSCGYHNWHRPDEYVALDEVAAALAAGADLIDALGCRRYGFGAGDDAASPAVEVTELRLPTRRA
jgi:acetylornithine deacetylase/succinyl-diaminopimelate desuccinylase-like protein